MFNYSRPEPEMDLKSVGADGKLNSISMAIDNVLSRSHTVLQILCKDRKGLLYDIMRTLKDYNIQVLYGRLSRNVNGNCEADLFFSQADGRKILDPPKQEYLCSRPKIEIPQPLRVMFVDRGPDTELLVATPIELCGRGRPRVLYDIARVLKILNIGIFTADFGRNVIGNHQWEVYRFLLFDRQDLSLKSIHSRRAQVKRVVLTSSISSLVPNPNWPPSTIIDENSWTDIEYCKRDKIWYPVSKTLAEKAAWEYANTHKMDMVAIHPSTCLGPLLQPGLNASSGVLLQLLQGTQDTQSNYWLGCVHVEDVAKAQILLYETPSASGRYLCTNGIIHFSDFAEVVAKICPEYPVHRFSEETQPGLVRCKDAAKKLIGLGLNFTPIEEAIQQSVASMKDRGFLK